MGTQLSNLSFKTLSMYTETQYLHSKIYIYMYSVVATRSAKGYCTIIQYQLVMSPKQLLPASPGTALHAFSETAESLGPRSFLVLEFLQGHSLEQPTYREYHAVGEVFIGLSNKQEKMESSSILSYFTRVKLLPARRQLTSDNWNISIPIRVRLSNYLRSIQVTVPASVI